MNPIEMSLKEFLDLLIRTLHEVEGHVYKAADAAKALLAENETLKARVVELTPPAPVDAPPAA